MIKKPSVQTVSQMLPCRYSLGQYLNCSFTGWVKGCQHPFISSYATQLQGKNSLFGSRQKSSIWLERPARSKTFCSDSHSGIYKCPTSLLCCFDKTLTKSSWGEGRTYVAYRFQPVIKESQGRSSSRKLEAQTEAGVVPGCCTLADSPWLA